MAVLPRPSAGDVRRHGEAAPLSRDPHDPSSPTSARLLRPARDDVVIATRAQLRREVARALVDAWISTVQRMPRFGVEQESALDVEYRDPRYSGASLPNPLAWINTHVVHPWRQRRAMIAEARALGIGAELATTLRRRFVDHWRSGRSMDFTRDEQTERLVDVLLAP